MNIFTLCKFNPSIFCYVLHIHRYVLSTVLCILSIGPASQSHVNRIHMHITRVGLDTKTIAILEQMSFHIDRACPMARDSSKPSF